MNTSDIDITSFLEKNASELSSTLNTSRIRAQILSPSEDGLRRASEKIQNGQLVAFPTETVYGLGADALNETAVRSIFQTKGRPLTDPLIVHVSCIDEALALTDSEEDIKELFRYLAEAFWPGPLTCVVRADLTKIPKVITANTGYVGLRQPRNKVAQDLIRYSQRPIAAPSANLFTHVSPTSPVHVFNDFFDKELSIIDGEKCEFGIESTVVKLVKDQIGMKLVVLRAGSLSDKALKDVLSKSDKFKDARVEKFKKEAHVSEESNAEAPGMLLKHYSPYIETYLVEVVDKQPQKDLEALEVDLNKTIVIDFNRALEPITQKGYLKYFSLSESGDLREAMGNLYSTLRAAENIEGAQQILILNLNNYYKCDEEKVKELPEYLETVYDKSFRSASGKKMVYDLSSSTFYREN